MVYCCYRRPIFPIFRLPGYLNLVIGLILSAKYADLYQGPDQGSDLSILLYFHLLTFTDYFLRFFLILIFL